MSEPHSAMSEEHLAPEALHFIGVCIPSVPHLEALLLLWETAPKLWATSEIAASIYVAEDRASEILRDLVRSGLVDRDVAQPMSFRCSTSSNWDGMLPLVSQTYRRQLSSVARYFHSQGSKPIREFSRAFRLRREQ